MGWIIQQSTLRVSIMVIAISQIASDSPLGAELMDSILVCSLSAHLSPASRLCAAIIGCRPQANRRYGCPARIPNPPFARRWYRSRSRLAPVIEVPRSCVHSYTCFLPPDVNTAGISRQDAGHILHPAVPQSAFPFSYQQNSTY